MSPHSDLRLVSINGSPRSPSRTESLVRAVGEAVVAATGADWRHFRITDIAADTLCALTRDRLDAAGEAIIREIESASIIVLGTPVYRASFTGALKHVFDLVDYRALRGRIAVVASTGGNRHHGLVTEHQLRPLMSFFGMHTAPTAIFAEEADFDAYRLTAPSVHERIACAASEVARLAGPARNDTVARSPFIEEILT